MPRRVLVVDREPDGFSQHVAELRQRGLDARCAPGAAAARRACDVHTPDIVVCGVDLPESSGLDLLLRLRREHPATASILIAPRADVPLAVRAMRGGVQDVLVAPVAPTELASRIERLIATRRAAESRDEPVMQIGELAARSAAMRGVMRAALGAARGEHDLVLVGEPGVGKRSLVRQALAAADRAAPCIEASLTTADAGWVGERIARLAVRRGAAPATVALYDIDGAEPGLQAEASRAAAGAGHAARFVITARSWAEGGAFWRLLCESRRSVVLHVPPLRERPSDVALLAELFLERDARAAGAPRPRLSPAALDELVSRDWPGNVAELERVMLQAVALCGDGLIDVPHLAAQASVAPAVAAPIAAVLDRDAALPLDEVLAGIERRLILLALERAGWNQQRAAAQLGIPRTTLRDRMGKHGIRAAGAA